MARGGVPGLNDTCSVWFCAQKIYLKINLKLFTEKSKLPALQLFSRTENLKISLKTENFTENECVFTENHEPCPRLRAASADGVGVHCPLTTGSVESDPSYDTPSLAWSL